MAQRPVYIPFTRAPYVEVYMPEFVWNGGFALSQKQKNIIALHESFNRRFPDKKLLEISSKSLQSLGIKMSAFYLKKEVASLGKTIPVECVFQGSKVYSGGGPYTDLYDLTPREAKGDPRLRTSGRLVEFQYEGDRFPLEPVTVFYDWIYINAILENGDYAEELIKYDGFTDIEFNPNKSLNCQARSAALFVSLSRLNLLDKCRAFSSFIKLF